MSLTYAFRMHVSRVEANQPPLAQKKISPRSMTAVNEMGGAGKPHWCRKWKNCLERQSNFFEKLRKHNGELGLKIGKIRDNANEYMQISRISIICFTNKTKVQKLTKKMSKKKNGQNLRSWVKQ